jgi:hypothetical protein
MAGCGIEYSWGKMKLEFRKSNLTIAGVKNNRNTEAKLREIMGKHLPIERIWRFERKSRDYRRLYLKLHALTLDPSIEKKELNFEELEKMRTEFKTHRNIGEIDRLFINEN